MGISKYDICSRALNKIGLPSISSFVDGTTESTVAGQIYEGKVLAALSAHEWHFSRDLRDLGAPLVDTPAARFGYAYQLPADLVKLIGLYFANSDSPLKYDRYGSMLFTDENGELAVDLIFRSPEALWQNYFIEALVVDLSADFAGGIKRNAGEAEAMRKRAEDEMWPTARRIDSQQQTTRPLGRSRLTAVRR